MRHSFRVSGRRVRVPLRQEPSVGECIRVNEKKRVSKQAPTNNSNAGVRFVQLKFLVIRALFGFYVQCHFCRIFLFLADESIRGEP